MVAKEIAAQDRAVVSYVFDRRGLVTDTEGQPIPLREWPGYSIERAADGNLRVWRGESLIQVFYPAAWAE
jgi:hypothetical protein